MPNEEMRKIFEAAFQKNKAPRPSLLIEVVERYLKENSQELLMQFQQQLNAYVEERNIHGNEIIAQIQSMIDKHRHHQRSDASKAASMADLEALYGDEEAAANEQDHSLVARMRENFVSVLVPELPKIYTKGVAAANEQKEAKAQSDIMKQALHMAVELLPTKKLLEYFFQLGEKSPSLKEVQIIVQEELKKYTDPDPQFLVLRDEFTNFLAVKMFGIYKAKFRDSLKNAPQKREETIAHFTETVQQITQDMGVMKSIEAAAGYKE